MARFSNVALWVGSQKKRGGRRWRNLIHVKLLLFLSGPLHWVVPDFGGGCSDPGDSTDHDHLLRSEGGLPLSIPANFGVGARGQERNESLAYPKLQQGKSPLVTTTRPSKPSYE